MASERRPSFLILRTRLPASESQELLGRLVTHICRPLENSTPQKPSQFIKSPPVEVSEANAELLIKGIADTDLKCKIYQLFSLRYGASSNSGLSLKAETIRTIRLRDHFKSFDELMDPSNTEVQSGVFGPRGSRGKGLLSRNGGVLYMVVGIKTCIQVESSASTTTGTALGGGSAMPTPGIPMSGASSCHLSENNLYKISSSGIGVGEEIFAIEYKKAVQRTSNRFFGVEKSELRLCNNVETFRVGNAIFSGNEADMSFDDDEVIEDAQVDGSDTTAIGKESLELLEDPATSEDVPLRDADLYLGWISD